MEKKCCKFYSIASYLRLILLCVHLIFIPVLTVCLLYFCSPHKDKNPSESCLAGQGGAPACWHQWSTTEERTKGTCPWSPQQIGAEEGLETSFSQALD